MCRMSEHTCDIILLESIQVFRSLKKIGQLALVSGLEKVNKYYFNHVNNHTECVVYII